MSTRFQLSLFLLLLALTLAPASAWSPDTHIALFEPVAADALDDGRLTFYVIDYDQGKAVEKLGDYQVAPEALEALKKAPDQFRAGLVGPDAYPTWEAGRGCIHKNADAWLTYLWEQAHTPEYRSPEVLAFVYGNMMHAAGDVFAHTLTNGQVSPEQKAQGTACLEAYISQYTPASTTSISIDGVEKFILRRMIWDDPNTPAGRRLQTLYEASPGWSLPAVLGRMRSKGASPQLDAALEALPKYSHRMAESLVSPALFDLSQLSAVTMGYTQRYLSGLSLPGVKGSFLDQLVSSAMGLTPSQLQTALQKSPEDLMQIDLKQFRYRQLGLEPNARKTDPEHFPAAHNTVIMSKMLLLEQRELNRLLADLGSDKQLEKANIMLGWLQDLDDSNQWTDGSLLAQDRVVFRRLFRFQGGARHVSSPIRVVGLTSQGSAGGEPAPITVTLNRPAPAGGVTVTLVTPMERHLQLPSHIIIPKGESQFSFTVPARRVHEPLEVPLMAAVAGVGGPECHVVLRPKGSVGQVGQPVAITPTEAENSEEETPQTGGPLDVSVEGPREAVVGQSLYYKAKIFGGQPPYKLEWVVDGHTFEDKEVAGCFYDPGLRFIILRVFDQGEYKEQPRLLRIRVYVDRAE